MGHIEDGIAAIRAAMSEVEQIQERVNTIVDNRVTGMYASGLHHVAAAEQQAISAGSDIAAPILDRLADVRLQLEEGKALMMVVERSGELANDSLSATRDACSNALARIGG